ncbi:unnamed protein product [Closterium sp. Naga37s-1]|nr:unnamed protein product [Closterium sp. Naga37s-1]
MLGFPGPVGGIALALQQPVANAAKWLGDVKPQPCTPLIQPHSPNLIRPSEPARLLWSSTRLPAAASAGCSSAVPVVQRGSLRRVETAAGGQWASLHGKCVSRGGPFQAGHAGRQGRAIALHRDGGVGGAAASTAARVSGWDGCGVVRVFGLVENGCPLQAGHAGRQGRTLSLHRDGEWLGQQRRQLTGLLKRALPAIVDKRGEEKGGREVEGKRDELGERQGEVPPPLLKRALPGIVGKGEGEGGEASGGEAGRSDVATERRGEEKEAGVGGKERRGEEKERGGRE